MRNIADPTMPLHILAAIQARDAIAHDVRNQRNNSDDNAYDLHTW